MLWAMPRRLLSLILCALLLVPGAALARAASYCKMSGRVGRGCCCKHVEPDAKQAPRGPEVSRPPCCEKLAVPDEGKATDIAPDFTVSAAALVALLPVPWHFGSAPRSLTHIPAQARGPPPLGPPIYLANCVLLS